MSCMAPYGPAELPGVSIKTEHITVHCDTLMVGPPCKLLLNDIMVAFLIACTYNCKRT